MRHISEEKELACQLQQARNTLEVRNNEYTDMCNRMTALDSQNNDVQQKLSDVLLQNKHLQDKLNKAYNEVR